MLNFNHSVLREYELWRSDNTNFRDFLYFCNSYFAKDLDVNFINYHGYPMRDINKCLKPSEEIDELINNPNNLSIINWSYRVYLPDNEFYLEPGTHSECRDWLKNKGLCNGNLFAPLVQDDEDIYYFEEVPLAVYDKKKHILWLLWDSTHDGVSEQGNIRQLKIIIKHFATKFQNNGIFQIQTPNKKVQSSNLFASDLTALNNERREFERYINELVEKLAIFNDKLKRNIALQAAQTTEIDLEITNSLVNHVEVREGSLIFYTKDIFITEFDKKKFFNYDFINLYASSEEIKKFFETVKKVNKNNIGWYAGYYKVTVNLKNLKINVKNLSSFDIREGYDGKGHHPHIRIDGVPCMGELSEMLLFAKSELDLNLIVDLIVQYLQTVNFDDEPILKRIHNWDLIDLSNNKILYSNKREIETVLLLSEKEYF